MARLRVGAARAVITPSVGCHLWGYFEDRVAVDIHGELYAKSVVLDTGEASLAICVCDLGALHKQDIDRAKGRAEELTGIPRENMFVAATHTHYAPPTESGYAVTRDDRYMEWVPDRIADSIRLAQNRLRPAVVGHASGACPGEVFNRRYWMKDGSVRMNPTPGPDIVRPAGPVDPEVGVLAALDDDRRPIAVLANYALHYVGGPSVLDTIVHADYFGAFDAAMQRMAGGECVAVMLNGCCGDINHIDVFGPPREYPHPFAEIDRVAEVVAGVAHAAWRGIRVWDAGPVLAVANRSFPFRRREVTPERLALARERLRRVSEEGLSGPATWDKDFLFDVTAVEIADTPLEWEVPLQAMRIGTAGIVGLPAEVFVEIGLDIKRRSPFERTLVGELANDYVGGYVPTDRAYDEGSYEVWQSPAERGMGEAMADAAVGLLERLAG